MEITEGLILEVAYNLYKRCLTTERKDVVDALKKAYDRETHPISKVQLRILLDCIEEAEKKGVCRCQDTGSPQFFVTIGSDSGVKVDIERALTEATAKAAIDLPMRDNVFHPLTHEWKPGGNTGWGVPVIWWDYLPGADYVEIMAAPRGGGGSLSWSGSFELPDPPSKSEAIKRVRDSIIKAYYEEEWFVGCAPGTIGICIGGGSKEHAALIAWKAVFRRPVGSHHSDPDIAKLEDDLLTLMNESGKGNTRGLSLGLTNVIGVHAEVEGGRGSGIALSANCNAVYDARARIFSDGKVEYLAGW